MNELLRNNFMVRNEYSVCTILPGLYCTTRSFSSFPYTKCWLIWVGSFHHPSISTVMCPSSLIQATSPTTLPSRSSSSHTTTLHPHLFKSGTVSVRPFDSSDWHSFKDSIIVRYFESDILCLAIDLLHNYFDSL